MQPTRAVEDYLKAIHTLGGADAMVSPAEIADELDVSGPSVTGMLKRLGDVGLINYKPGSGAKLTERGRTEARRVIRRHRLVELFLTQVLGLDWSEVDAEAESLEHAISPRLEEAIAKYLNEPLEDPHGHVIPTPEGEMASRELRRVSDYRQGARVKIREVQDDDPDRLRRWQEQGLTPGATIAIRSYQELDDVFEIEVNDKVLQLSSSALAGLRGEECSAL